MKLLYPQETLKAEEILAFQAAEGKMKCCYSIFIYSEYFYSVTRWHFVHLIIITDIAQLESLEGLQDILLFSEGGSEEQMQAALPWK